MRHTVFVVDDSKVNSANIANGLVNHFDVITIESGELLFESLNTSTPDIILLGIAMPGMNGFQVVEKMKQNVIFAKIPVIFLTDFSDEETEIRGLELGARDFVTKPFSMPVLINRIKTHINIDKVVKKHSQDAERISTSLDTLHRNLLFVLADIVENRDKGTGGHVYRTIRYTEVLIAGMLRHGVYAKEIGGWDIQNILTSVALHDIGKIGISDTILNKPGKLTDKEFKEMKKHAIDGAAIISKAISRIGSDKFLHDAQLFAEYHHENWDGTGYPHGLKGAAIPLQGRIMAFADVYDALVSERPYKQPYTSEEAVNIIMNDAGKKFDPLIANVFFSVRDKFAEIHREYKEPKQ